MIKYIVIVTDTSENNELTRVFSSDNCQKVREHVKRELIGIGCQYHEIGNEIFYQEVSGIEHRVIFTLDQIERVNL